MYFAAQTNSNFLSALGINWKLLVTQALAFAVLVWILSKFVYPPLIASIDARRAQIEAGIEEAKQAEAALQQAEAKAEELLAEARTEADSMIARTQQETASMIAEAEEKAKAHAEQILTDARQQFEGEVRKAREQLKTDTVQLVAIATERIIGEKLDAQKDSQLIERSLAKERT